MHRLLVVEDQRLVREGIVRMISSIYPDRFAIIEAGNGLDGIKMADEMNPDIIITDVVMPKLSGLDMIQELSVKYPRMLFIIMSAYKNFDYAVKAMELGVKEYLMKPITEKMLFASIEKLIWRISHDYKEEYSDLIMYDYFSNIDITIEPQVVPKYTIIESMNSAYWSIGLFEEKSGDSLKLHELQKKLEFIFQNIHIPTVSFQNYRSRVAFIFNYNNINEFEQMFDQSLGDISSHAIVGVSESQLGKGMQLKTLFKQAEYALDQATYFNSSFVFFKSKNQNYSGLVTKSFCEDLLNRMIAGEKVAVNKLLDDLFTKFNYLITSKEMVQNEFERVLLYFELIHTFPDDIKTALNSFRKQMLSANTIFRIKANMFALCQNVMDIYTSNLSGMNSIKNALTYIDKHLTEKISAAKLANLCNLSYNYFCTYFVKLMGMTSTQYINEVRLHHAKDLLEHSLMKVTEVAELSGFSDYRYFSKLFKEKYGENPSRFNRT